MRKLHAKWRCSTNLHPLLALIGCAESGIPDYRSPHRPEYTPLQHGDFITKEATRQRYWARSMIGYKNLSRTVPNDTHKLLAKMEGMGKVKHVITQNVDRHHQGAGSQSVLELHGTIHEVECIQPECSWTGPRQLVQEMMEEDNELWILQYAESLTEETARPDGDVVLPASAYSTFHMPKCPSCGSELLKPRVVFHGGQIPQHVKEAATAAVDAADALLILGTTLSTWSGFRLAKRVCEAGKPIAVVNYGPTRADRLNPAPLTLHASTSAVLHALMAGLQR